MWSKWLPFFSIASTLKTNGSIWKRRRICHLHRYGTLSVIAGCKLVKNSRISRAIKSLWHRFCGSIISTDTNVHFKCTLFKKRAPCAPIQRARLNTYIVTFLPVYLWRRTIIDGNNWTLIFNPCFRRLKNERSKTRGFPISSFERSCWERTRNENKTSFSI